MAGLRHVRGVRPNRTADFRGGGAILDQIRPEPGLVFILPLIAVLTKEPEMLQPDAFREHTMQQNVTNGRGSALDPAGELTALPQALAGFKGPLRGEEEEGKGRGRRGGEGKGRRGAGRERKGRGG